MAHILIEHLKNASGLSLLPNCLVISFFYRMPYSMMLGQNARGSGVQQQLTRER